MRFHGRWRRTLGPSLAFTLLVVPACSNEPRRSNPNVEAAPSQAAVMADVMRSVSDKVEVLEILVPGGVVEVRLGAETKALTFGRADTRSGRDMGPDDRFQIGSITKTMVAALVLQIVADGDLAWTIPSTTCCRVCFRMVTGAPLSTC